MFQNEPFVDPLQKRCFWIIHKFRRKAHVLQSPLIKLLVLRTANLLKRDSNTGFFTVNFKDYLSTSILQRIYERLVLKHQCTYLKAPYLTEHLQWVLLTVSDFQPATSLKRRLRQRCFFVNFAKNIREPSWMSHICSFL